MSQPMSQAETTAEQEFAARPLPGAIPQSYAGPGRIDLRPGLPPVVLIRAMYQLSGPDRTRYWTFIILRFISIILLMSQPLVLSWAINTLQTGGAEAFGEITLLALGYAALSLVFWMTHGPSRVLERENAWGVHRAMVHLCYDRMRHAPLSWHQNHHSGALINRINIAAEGMQRFSQQIYLHTETLAFLFLPIVVLAWIAPWVGIAAAIFMAGIFPMILWFDKKLKAGHIEHFHWMHRFSGALFDYLGNITTIITLRLGGVSRSELEGRYNHTWPANYDIFRINEWKWFSMSMVIACIYASGIILYAAQTTAEDGVLMAGTAVAVFQYLRRMDEGFSRFAMNWQEIVEQYARLESLRPLMAAPQVEEVIAIPDKTWSEISIRALTCTHAEASGEKRSAALNDIDLDIAAGERIALIGESGAGKSTLMRVLRAVLVADEGRFMIDGQTAQQEDLAALATLAPQDPEIFNNTIRFNITAGMQAGEAELGSALALSCFDSVLPGLPNGLETDIRERGVNLSGGQKQRLALARALFFANRQSSLLLLDEATSSVDAETEDQILTRLFAAWGRRTLVASVHRLNVLPMFDRVIVMDKGHIIAAGHHEQLLAENESYAARWSAFRRHMDADAAE